MKLNFTYLVRTSICVLLLSVAFTSSFAQTNQQGHTAVNNLKASVENDRLFINWNVTEVATTTNYCQVQASIDGTNFSTIGLVMGADPKQTNNGFSFKQNLSKMKPGMQYYRILTVDANNMVSTSNVIAAK